MPPHIFLIGGYPNLEVPSGMISYVTNLIPGLLRNGAEVTLIGVPGESSEPPFKIKLIPLGRFEDADSWTVWAKLWCVAAAIRLPPNAVLHAQKTLDMLPFCLLRPSTPKVLTVHGNHRVHIRQKYGGLAASIYGLFERITFRLVSKVVFVSKELYLDHSERLHHPDEGHYATLPPGVDEKVFHPASKDEARARLGLGGGVVIGFSGRCAPEKRIDLLLDVFAKFKQKHGSAKLLLLGPSEGDLRSLGIPDPRSMGIQAMGMLPRDQVAQALAAMDVFVLTSDREGLPTALLEAVTVGIPVVTRDVGDVAEIVVDESIGFIVPSSNPDAITERVAKAMNLRISDEARMKVIRRFSWTKISADLMDIYENLLREPHVHD